MRTIAPCLACGGTVPAKLPTTCGQQPRLCSLECRRAYRKAYTVRWRQANRVRIARRRDANRAQVRAWGREFYARNRARRKQLRIEWYRKNSARALEAAQHYAATHRDTVRAIGRKNRQVRRARLLSAFVEAVDPRVVFQRDKGICGICMKSVTPDTTWHIDHVIPLAKGGVHAYSNVQLAHDRCNRIKGARVPA